MNYNKSQVMSMVADALGDNPVGLFVDFNFLDSGECEPALVSNLEGGFYIEDTKDFHCCAGATKLCIIPKNSHLDYVIKIPFTGVWDTDAFNEMYIYGKFDTDYICEEINIYNQVSPETRKILARNEFVGLYCGIPVYVQERANTVYACSDRVINYVPKMGLKLYKTLVDGNFVGNFCKNFIMDLLSLFGYAKVLTILNDLNTYTCDFHDENYGYTRYGSPIIIDYGGYSCVEAWHELDDESEYFEDE